MMQILSMPQTMVALLFWLGIPWMAFAQTPERYHPFVLAANEPGALTAKIPGTSTALKAQGFNIVGEYAPSTTSHVIVVTHPILQQQANQQSSLGESFAVAQRVSLTEVDGKVQTAYFNPVYMGYAYRVADIKPYTEIKTLLAAALSTTPVSEFGAAKGSMDGLTARQLSKYKYAPGMEYFDDVYDLAKYENHKQAVQAVTQALEKKSGGAFKIYQITVENQKRTLFGVGLTENFSGDAKILSIIDKQEYRHTAHFPYEILVDNNRVIALDARFRIAISWPTLKMAGEVSFLKIIKTPADIEKALTLAAGGQLQKADSEFDEWQ